MASFTSRLRLRKTASNEVFDVKRDLSNNLDIIDQKVLKAYDEPWTSFNNPFNNVGVRILRCKYKFLGTRLFYQFNGYIATVPTGTITVNLPPGCSIDAARYPLDNGIQGAFVGYIRTISLIGNLTTRNSHTLQPHGPGVGVWNATTPITWVAGISYLSFDVQMEVKRSGY